MMILVRKIERGKWMQVDLNDTYNVSADAVSGCMRTRDNELSTWAIDTRQEIEQAILAIVSGGQHIDAMDFLCLDSDYISQLGIRFSSEKPGKTAMRGMVDKHFDLVNLRLADLCNLAHLTVAEFRSDSVVRKTKKDLMELINGAIARGEIDHSLLDPHLRSKIPQPT